MIRVLRLVLNILLLPLRPLMVIAPTERAAWVAAGLAPVAVVIAATAPGAWIAAPILGGVLVLLVVLDALLIGKVEGWEIRTSEDIEVGQPTNLAITARFAGRQPRSADAALACDPRLAEEGRVALTLSPEPYGEGWRGVTQAATLGYWVGAPFAGQGRMSEAVRIVIPFAFLSDGRRLEGTLKILFDTFRDRPLALSLSAGEVGLYLPLQGRRRVLSIFTDSDALRRAAGPARGRATSS